MDFYAFDRNGIQVHPRLYAFINIEQRQIVIVPGDRSFKLHTKHYGHGFIITSCVYYEFARR